jgi:ribosomal protein L37E
MPAKKAKKKKSAGKSCMCGAWPGNPDKPEQEHASICPLYVEPAKPRLPKISRKMIEQVRRDLPAHMEAQRQDEQDRRCLRGKYAPTRGVCAACGGPVVGKVRFRDTGRIGGPPATAYVSHWECEDCGLMYGKVPPDWAAYRPR